MGLQERQMIRTLTETTLPGREQEIAEICGSGAKYEVAWDTLQNDAAGLNFLDNVSCHRLNMALRTIAMDPLGKEALRDGLKAVKLANVASPAEKSLAFANGVLEMRCAYAAGLSGAFSDGEIYHVLMKGL
jgi:hypothetical protein